MKNPGCHHKDSGDAAPPGSLERNTEAPHGATDGDDTFHGTVLAGGDWLVVDVPRMTTRTLDLFSW